MTITYRYATFNLVIFHLLEIIISKTALKALILACGLAPLFLSGCPIDPPAPNLDFVAPDMGTPDQIPASNATSYPSTEEEAIALFNAGSGLLSLSANTAYPGTITNSVITQPLVIDRQTFAATFDNSNTDLHYFAEIDGIRDSLSLKVVDNPNLISSNWLNFLNYTKIFHTEIQTLQAITATNPDTAFPCSVEGKVYKKEDTSSQWEAILAAPSVGNPEFYTVNMFKVNAMYRFTTGAALSVNNSNTGMGAKFILSMASNVEGHYEGSTADPYVANHPQSISPANLKVYNDNSVLILDINTNLGTLGFFFIY